MKNNKKPNAEAKAKNGDGNGDLKTEKVGLATIASLLQKWRVSITNEKVVQEMAHYEKVIRNRNKVRSEETDFSRKKNQLLNTLK